MSYTNSTMKTSTGDPAGPIHHSGSQNLNKGGPAPSDCTRTATSFLIAMMVFLTIIHIVRIASVHIQMKGWELDNIAAQVSYGLILAMMSYGMAWTIRGGTNDITPPPPDLIMRFYLPFLGFYYAAVLFVKLSLLLFYARIFSINQQSLRLRFTGVSGTLVLINGLVLLIWTGIVYMFFASSVVFWKESLETDPDSGVIYQLNSVGLAVVGIGNAFTDILLLALAIWGIWHTQLSTEKKRKASALVGLGVLAIVASIFRACQANIDLDGKWGPAYQNLAHLIAIVLETILGFFCLCIPALNDVLVNRGYAKHWYISIKMHLPSFLGKRPFQHANSMMKLPRHRAATTESQDTAEITLIEVLSESREKLSKAKV